MKRLVEFPLQEGGSVVVQIDEPDIGGTVRAARGDTIEQAKETLEDALNKVLPAARSIVEKLEGMRPNEVEVTFGISLSFKAGAFITAGTDANFGVTVRWTGNTEQTHIASAEGKSEPQTNSH
jgi:predicted RNase H-like HicB family nuclease